MKAAEHLMPADESRPAEGEGPCAFLLKVAAKDTEG